MEVAWYFRLFYMPILIMIVSFFLGWVIKAKRMTSPGPSKPWMIGSMITFVVFIALLWFVPFSINLAFWIGLGIIAFGEVVFALGFIAMREYPERKQAVVDWGIYRVSRHSHVMAGIITTLGVIVMGWSTGSIIYSILWVFFVLDIIMRHFAVLSEEKINIEKFGEEYVDYMKRVPRYFFIK